MDQEFNSNLSQVSGSADSGQDRSGSGSDERFAAGDDAKSGPSDRSTSNRDDRDERVDAETEPEAWAQSVVDEAKAASPPGGPRFVIEWRPADVSRIRPVVERLTIRMSVPIYVHGQKLVLVSRAGSLQVDSSEMIHVVTPALLSLVLSTFIVFVERKAHGDEEIPIPKALLSAMNVGPAWHFPPLTALTALPPIVAGGRIIDTPGYDRQSGIYYAPPPGLDVPAIPERPTWSQVQAALALLKSMLSDVLFADKAVDLAAVLSAVLTVLVRNAIDGCVPVFVLSAATPGSGKTEVAQICAWLQSGRDAAVEAMGSDAEVEKRVTAHVMAGNLMIVFDNVKRQIGGPALEAASTSRVWSGRKLRTSDLHAGPMQAVIFITGNSLSYSTDMLRRLVIAQLTTELEHVSERPLQRPDLRTWVLANRGQLIAAALTIVRGHIASGSPDMGLKPMRGYDQWSGVVRSALVWAGTVDPVQNSPQAKADADPEAEAFGITLKHIEMLFSGEVHFTSKELSAALRSAPSAVFEELVDALRIVLGDNPLKLGPLQFSRAIKKLLDRNVGGRLMKCVRRGNEGNVYKIVRIAAK